MPHMLLFKDNFKNLYKEACTQVYQSDGQLIQAYSRSNCDQVEMKALLGFALRY